MDEGRDSRRRGGSDCLRLGSSRFAHLAVLVQRSDRVISTEMSHGCTSCDPQARVATLHRTHCPTPRARCGRATKESEMSWARFDDNYSLNPKILMAGYLAELLDMRAIIWCARYETDGFVSEDALSIVGRSIPGVKAKIGK